MGPISRVIEAAKTAIVNIISISKSDEIEHSGTYKPDIIKGEIIFENVSFAYPASKDIIVIKNLNMKIEAGQKIALVGQSGCGKSTIAGLL